MRTLKELKETKQLIEIKFCLDERSLDILKKALKAYNGARTVTADFLGLIEYQEQKQKGN